MTLAIFYDTETTGLPLFKEPSEDPRQPHMVQLGACLVDLDTQREISCIDVIVRPEGWTIPDEVSAIHGITTEHAMNVGVPESMALGMLLDLWQCAAVRIGHNEQFDARIVRIAQLRHDDTDIEAWQAGTAECTQRLATPIMKLPPTPKMAAAGFTKNKSANLREAYLHFTGRQLDGAHNAMVDVRGCMAVYFAIKAGQREAVTA